MVQEHTLNRLLSIINAYAPDADVALIRKAYAFSQQAHTGQKRLTGEDFCEHTTRTAIVLAETIHADIPTIVAGILHDTIEDTPYTHKDITKEFGQEIADLVIGCTNMKKQIEYQGAERYIENLRKLFVSMAKDLRVIFIKLADRIDNLKTLYAHPPEKQELIAKEALEIYAPIANRLGIGEIRVQIQDLAFPYVYPDEYSLIKKIFDERMRRVNVSLDSVIATTKKYIVDAGIPVRDMHARIKSLFSLYQKILRYDKNLENIESTIEQIHDLRAVRIIVDTIPQCYATLGILHSFCTPMKGKIKDYIATPKSNGYKSLHTTLLFPIPKKQEQDIIEFQIRTQAMHEENEYGAATHWHYSEVRRSEKLHPHLIWVKELTRWKKELQENQQYLESLKLDVLKNRILVKTPNGDWIDLPEGATPVDYAYHIHTELGNTCVGAKVNSKFVPLNTELQSHDVVEIITNKQRKGPDPDWLKFVKTNTARAKIRESTKQHLLQWLKNVVPGTTKHEKKKKEKKDEKRQMRNVNIVPYTK